MDENTLVAELVLVEPRVAPTRLRIMVPTKFLKTMARIGGCLANIPEHQKHNLNNALLELDENPDE